MAEDRTSEFLSLAKNLPSSRAGGGGGGGSNTLVTSGPSSGRYGRTDATTAPAYAQLKDFHSTAGTISRDIASTSALLGELTQLVRQKSLFVDDSQRVNGLVMQIKSSIENLNGRLEEAGTVIAQQKRQLGKNSQAGQEASNLVGQLKEEFVQATAGFKKVLQQRTDTLKETSDRKRQVYGGGIGDGNNNNNNNGREEYSLNLQNKPSVYYDQEDDNPMPNMSGMGPMLDLTSGMSAGEPTSSSANLPRPHGASSGDSSGMRLRKTTSDPMPSMGLYSGGNSSSSYYGRQESNPLTPWDIQRMEQESGQDLMMQLIPDQDYLQERANAMEQVETNIVELGTIYNKLAVMVSEHREMVQRVEDNVDEANSTINLSLNTLTDTLQSLQTNRQLFLKLFAILVIFIISFIIFFA